MMFFCTLGCNSLIAQLPSTSVLQPEYKDKFTAALNELTDPKGPAVERAHPCCQHSIEKIEQSLEQGPIWCLRPGRECRTWSQSQDSRHSLVC